MFVAYSQYCIVNISPLGRAIPSESRGAVFKTSTVSDEWDV